MAIRGNPNRFFISIFVLSGIWGRQGVTVECVSSPCHLDSFACGDTTLPNGEIVKMVPKLMEMDDAKWMLNVPGLEIVDQRYICEKPACSSDPCRNGATCTETLTGFECSCPHEFYGPTCGCPIISTPDVGDTRAFSYHDLNITQGMTSFEVEVRASGGQSFIGLFRSIGEEYVYEIALGAFSNTAGRIRSRSITVTQRIARWTLSGISTYDHFHISFLNGLVTLSRDGNDDVITCNDESSPEINVVGIWTGFGSHGFWKFPTFCPFS